MTPDLLEKINNIVNVELIPQQLREEEKEELMNIVNFKKLNEAIEKGLEIEISNLLTEDAEEGKLKSRLSRIFGSTKIPAATLGLIMLATGAAQACGQKKLEGTNLNTRCFTPTAMAEIKKEEDNLEKIARANQRRALVKSISFKDSETKTYFPSRGQYNDKNYDTSKDKMQIVTVYNVEGEEYIGALDLYEKDKPMLMVPSIDGKQIYAFANKRHMNGEHKVSWKLIKVMPTTQAGPLSKLYAGLARFIENDKKAKAREK